MNASLAAAVLAGLGASLFVAPRPRMVVPAATETVPTSTDGGRSGALRLLVAGAAGAAAWVFLGGAVGAVLALPAAVACWRVLSRAEPAVVRRRREQATRDLPHLIGLLGAGLRSGAPPEAALAGACAALPGPAAEALLPARARLLLGVDPVRVWHDLGDDPTLRPLGRALARGHETGASVVETVEALAQSLADEARAGVEDRARAVGVRAALPLGLCLLPAFLLLGIVPLVAGLVGQLAWG